MDSNHDKQIQNLQCYRYTTRQKKIRFSGKRNRKCAAAGAGPQVKSPRGNAAQTQGVGRGGVSRENSSMFRKGTAD